MLHPQKMNTVYNQWVGKDPAVLRRYISIRSGEGYRVGGNLDSIEQIKNVIPLAVRDIEKRVVALVGYSLFRDHYYIREQCVMNGHVPLEEIVNPQRELPGIMVEEPPPKA